MFESDPERIDLGVGLMTIQLANLPTVPARYADIVDEYLTRCEAETG